MANPPIQPILAETNGILMTPAGLAPGIGMLYDPWTGKALRFVKLNPNQGTLAPGVGISYVNGKPQNFVNNYDPVAVQKRAAAGPTPAPAAAPQAYDPARDPLVPDAQLTERLNQLSRARDDAITGLNTQATTTQREYGYKGTYNPATGAYEGASFDPTDPYSRASLLKRSYDSQRRGQAQSLGGQGQLYAGSFQATQNYLTRNQLKGEDALQKSLGTFLANVEAKKAAAGTVLDLRLLANGASQTITIYDRFLEACPVRVG